MNYRHEARLRLEAAKKELASNDDTRLKYAALDLRMAMEALTYDRALAYKDEFPPEEYQTWQPKKVMAVLFEIDSSADADTSLAIGAEIKYGVPAPVMQSLGTDEVLDMQTLRKHYDALGSYLHLPSIKQMQVGATVDATRLRMRCDEIVVEVERSLSSPIFNITLGEFGKFDCERCQHRIRRRLSRDNPETEAECFDCHATYALIKLPNGKIEIRPKRQDVECGRHGCTGVGLFWDTDLRSGKHWKCNVCGGRNILTLAQYYEEAQ